MKIQQTLVLAIALVLPCNVTPSSPTSGDTMELIDKLAEAGNTNNNLRGRNAPPRRRQLFYFSNILYALHVCNGSSNWCPDPHCDGPLKPRSCDNNGSGGSGGGGSGGGSSSGGNKSGASSDYSGNSYYTNDDTNYYYSGQSSYSNENASGASDNNGNTGTTQPRQSSNLFWYYLIAGGATVAIIAGLAVKKRETETEQLSEENLDHELNNGVAKRIGLVAAGKTVLPVHKSSQSIKFVDTSKSSGGGRRGVSATASKKSSRSSSRSKRKLTGAAAVAAAAASSVGSRFSGRKKNRTKDSTKGSDKETQPIQERIEMEIKDGGRYLSMN